MILAPFFLKQERKLAEEMKVLLQKGYTRIVIDGETKFLEELLDHKEDLENLPPINLFTNNYKNESKRNNILIILFNFFFIRLLILN
jgi:excinuclease ABC subunit A